MKKIAFFLVLLFIHNNFFSNNFFSNRSFIVNRFEKIIIKDNYFIYYEDGPEGYKVFVEGNFLINTINNFNILKISGKDFIFYYLDDSIFLVDISTGQYILGTDYSEGGLSISIEPHLKYFINIKADSFLKEGDTNYHPSNLCNYDLLKPWVEGEKGSGIGTKLILQSEIPTNNIVIANGFFDPKKLYLYNFNNRVKKIKIYNNKKTFEKIVSLNDVYNFQLILLPEKTRSLIIEILEVYKGSKYNDTAIAGIFTNIWTAQKEE